MGAVSLRDTQVAFLQKFAHLYDSGVPLAEALEIARRDIAEPLHAAIAQVVEDLYRGSSLADAMARREDIFGPEVVGIIRSGEQRGELGDAARSAATGLSGRVFDPRRLPAEQVDGLLLTAGDARVVHLEPTGRVRLRTAAGLSDGGEMDAPALGEAVAQRAGIDPDGGNGAFLWNDRLIRVVVTPTAQGPSTVVRLSGVPGPEPAEAKAWRKARRAGLLVVVGGRYADKDACLRSILKAFDPARFKCVSVDLPVPEALCVADLGSALQQDPDVVALAYPTEDLDLVPWAIEEGIRIVVGSPSAELFDSVPHRVLRV